MDILATMLPACMHRTGMRMRPPEGSLPAQPACFTHAACPHIACLRYCLTANKG